MQDAMLKATIGPEMVDMSDMHRHLFSHSLQGLAATVSFINLVISALRFNERDTGRAVSLLVGFPFLLTNIGFRLIGFSLLFCYFETVWIFLCLGLLFCISAFSVQLTARESLCVRLCKSTCLFADGCTSALYDRYSFYLEEAFVPG